MDDEKGSTLLHVSLALNIQYGSMCATDASSGNETHPEFWRLVARPDERLEVIAGVLVASLKEPGTENIGPAIELMDLGFVYIDDVLFRKTLEQRTKQPHEKNSNIEISIRCTYSYRFSISLP